MKPDLQQQNTFLSQAYFGTNGSSELDRFISRAYRDMNRTLWGIGKLDKSNKTRVLNGSKGLIKAAVIALYGKPVTKNPVLGFEFDQWHTELCLKLKSYYATHLQNVEAVHLTYGQAQKWVNMTIKYCWVCGGVNLSALEPWFPVAHVPIDEVILLAAENEGPIERPCKRWSVWDDKMQYQVFQNKLREIAAKRSKIPLQLEDVWWSQYRSKAIVDGEDQQPEIS